MASQNHFRSVEIQWEKAIAFDSDTAEKLDEKAKSGLDRVAGSGTSEQLEGKAQQAAGKIQKNVNKVPSQAEGTLKQVKGKAKEDIGTTKSAIEDATDDATDRVKSFFK